jgi:hypothetical protein
MEILRIGSQKCFYVDTLKKFPKPFDQNYILSRTGGFLWFHLEKDRFRFSFPKRHRTILKTISVIQLCNIFRRIFWCGSFGMVTSFNPNFGANFFEKTIGSILIQSECCSVRFAEFSCPIKTINRPTNRKFRTCTR